MKKSAGQTSSVSGKRRPARAACLSAAFGAVLLNGTAVFGAETGNVPALIPWPAALERGEGSFALTADSVLVADEASRLTAAQLAGFLEPATGFELKTVSSARRARSVIALSQDKSLTSLGAEGYELVVTPKEISLTAQTQAGLFYAVQTLRQLLPPQVFSTNIVKDVEWRAPCLKITDVPRFGWRGLLIDTGHDFQNLPFIFRFIDLMALHKFNTLHWHITDLGTWPLEIKGYPKLIDPSTRRAGVKPGYYTQDQVRQAKKKAENLQNEEELQSYFVKRIETFLNSKGRRLIGWDEILEGGLAPNAAVMSWRGMDGGITAAKAGHDVVMAPTTHTYFDYAETTTPLEKVYSFEPVPAGLTPEQAAHILGAQAQMWTDNHPTEKDMERLVYPRACALSEAVWSPAGARDYKNFRGRLAVHEQRMTALSVNYLPAGPAGSP